MEKRVERRIGSAKLRGIGADRTVADFWSWAFSDLLNNTERGILAECLVAVALGCDSDTVRRTWDPYALLSPEQVRVEVKSSAWLQSWKQKRPSTFRFGIAKARKWDENLADYAGEALRHSDVYVFCVFTGRDRKDDLLDAANWEFHVVATKEIDRIFGDQKTVVLRELRMRCGSEPAPHAELRGAILRAAGRRPNHPSDPAPPA